jgi:hypothetical protein
VELERSDGKNVYVKPTLCPSGSNFASDCGDEVDCLENSTATGAPNEEHCTKKFGGNYQHCTQSSLCCPSTGPYMKATFVFTDGGKKEGCVRLGPNGLTIKPAGTPTTPLMKYIDFMKNPSASNSQPITVSVTGCSDATTTSSDTTCGGNGRRLPWDDHVHRKFGQGRKLQGAPQAFFLAPFRENSLANYFKFNTNNGGICAWSASASEAYTAFASVSTKKTASGCALFVTLEDTENPDTDAEELISVDGVELSCLFGLQVPYVQMALNIIPALKEATKAAPRGGEMIDVVTKDANGKLKTRSTKLTYEKYRAIETEFEALKSSGGGIGLPQCWTSSTTAESLWDCVANPTTCSRQANQQRDVNDEKTVAYKNMRDGVVPFITFNSIIDMKTGQPIQDSPNDWTAGTCEITVHGLYDEHGNAICGANQGKKTIPVFTQPQCEYTNMKEINEDLKSTLNKMSNGEMKNDPMSLASLTSTDSWFACVNLVKSLQKEETVQKTRKTSECTISYPNTCGKPTSTFCQENPSNAWCHDPCCNWMLSRTMCCAPTARTFDTKKFTVLQDQVAARCANDPSLSNSVAGKFIASAIVNARNFVDVSSNPEICFEDYDRREKEINVIEKVPRCCFQSIVHRSWNNQDSIQYCNTDEDCFSGKCSDKNAPTNVAGTRTEACFNQESYEGKKKICQKVDGINAGPALGKCLNALLETSPKAIALLKKTFVDGNMNATNEEIGEGIFEHVGDASCEGPTGYFYDPRSWCQNETCTMIAGERKCICTRNCDGESCKAMCLAKKACSVDTSSCDGKSVCGIKKYWGNGYYLDNANKNTEGACHANVCNVKDSATNEGDCLGSTGRCDRYSCNGCDTDWSSSQNNFCIEENVTENDCLNRSSHKFDAGSSLCYQELSSHQQLTCLPTETAKRWNVDCQAIPFDSCGVSNPTDAISGKVSLLLQCRQTKHAKCKTKASCEAAGQCHGGIRSDYHEETGGVWKSHFKPYVCVLPTEDDWSCQKYKTCTPDTQSQWCHDGMVTGGRHCVVARMNETVCSASGGTWTSTTYDRARCLSEKRCMEGYWQNDKNQVECENCGGSMVSSNTWEVPTWVNPKWEPSPRHKWVNKTMVSENKWQKRIEQWRFSNFFHRISRVFREENSGIFSACMIGRQAHALEIISGICGSGAAPSSTEVLGLIAGCVETAKVNLIKDVAETVGNLKESNIQVRKNTLPSNIVEAPITLCEESYIPGIGKAGVGRRRRSRRLAVSAKSLDSADCFTVVENSKGKLIGQLIGDCLKVGLGVSLANPAALCLKLNDNAEINPAFSERDFAVRTTNVGGTFSYIAKTLSTSNSGDNLCADVPGNGVYCPIARVPNPEAVGEDQGGGTCHALEALVEKVQSKKAAIKCKAGDSASCTWLEPGSTSFYIGIGSVILLIIGGLLFVQGTYCAHKHRHILKKHLTEKFFNSMDTDGSGTLDASEIQRMLEHEFNATVSHTQARRLMKKFGATEMDFATYKKFVEYLKSVDKENGGGIEMKEILEKRVWKRGSMVQMTINETGEREFTNPLAQINDRPARISRNSWDLKVAPPAVQHIRKEEAARATKARSSKWEKHIDPHSGNPYFHNVETNETSWTNPEDCAATI